LALRSKAFLALVPICSLAAFMPLGAVAQHITVDGRLSSAQTLVGPNYWIGANLGKQVGSNLFHSFGQFGLATGESATFSGPATISNVIGRVTGGSTSSIDGRIQSNIAGANLYLINPSGVVFGPHATVKTTDAAGSRIGEGRCEITEGRKGRCLAGTGESVEMVGGVASPRARVERATTSL
jgi:filamentous hemagglutinin family protein